ncbi:ski oncogene-like isoform X2 [Amphiura filiformis]|uniref:ski oncogene-like isoform X2 n=1 Tax=Amphiura filiformis TaxID=82378 RepID=UPI003B210E92
MEQHQSQPFNPSLEKVLKNYQNVAMSSLGGPSRYSWPDAMNAGLLSKLADMEAENARAVVAQHAQHMAAAAAAAHEHRQQQQRIRDMKSAAAAAAAASSQEKEKILKYMDFESDMLHPPPFPIQQMPVFTPIDQSPSEKSETILEGETIACFIVGGEKRLCLPQILNSVLREFSLQQINGVCDELHIYCSRCSPEQLEILKVTGVLPFSAPSCGLITKTDAERLGNALLYGVLDKRYSMSSKGDSSKRQGEHTIKVYHECFGKCRGVFNPELYQTPHCPCIECDECGMTFSPQKFVVHSHKGRENRTCHWGFDSANWRSYLLLSKDQHPEEKYRNWLDEMKSKFDYVSRFKRKQVVDENGNNKKIKVEDAQREMCKDAIVTSAWSPDGTPGPQLQRPSAFRPWSPSALAKEGKAVLPEHGTVLVRDSRGIPTYLSMGPPVLLNPERVVPHTAATKFDGHFAPNVSLVPQTKAITPKKEEVESSRTTPNGEQTSQDSNTSEDSGLREDGHSEISETSLEQEIDMVRSLLENEQLDSQAGRDKLLHELARIRVRQEERLQSALTSKKSLQQELEFLRATKKEKLREASETKRNLRKEIDRIRIEYERKLREASEAKQRLKRDLEIAKSKKCDKTHELGKDKVRLRAENEYLRERLTEVEEERDQLRKEVDELKKQITDSSSESSENELSKKSENNEKRSSSSCSESTKNDSSQPPKQV